MKYYQIGTTAEPKVVGVKDGLYQVEINKVLLEESERFQEFLNFFRYANSSFWKRQNEIKDLKIPSIQAKLLKKAKITDIMGYTPNITFMNDLYSERYLNIIKAFDIGDYYLFDVDIKNVVEKYYLLFFKTILLENINYEKSVIYTGHKLRKNIEYFKLKNYDDFYRFMQLNPLAKFEKLSIPKEYFGKDIIQVQASSLPFYSEKIIDFLLNCGVTNFQPIYNNSIELDFY